VQKKTEETKTHKGERATASPPIASSPPIAAKTPEQNTTMSARADSLARLLERGHRQRAARVVVRKSGEGKRGARRAAGAAAGADDTRTTAALSRSIDFF
jgi:hypothetical protein